MGASFPPPADCGMNESFPQIKIPHCNGEETATLKFEIPRMEEKTFCLDHPEFGTYLVSGIWCLQSRNAQSPIRNPQLGGGVKGFDNGRG